MGDYSVSDSNTHHRHRRVSLEENSLSSQESTNHTDQQTVSNSHKYGESTAGSQSIRQHKILPLSGNPYFTCVITKSQIQPPFQTIIPKSFHPFLPSASGPVVLSCENKDWEMMYYGRRSVRRFDAGWRKFAEDNNLKVGDGCVLELMDSTKWKFRVQILSGEIPDEITDSGRSFESPIVIS